MNTYSNKSKTKSATVQKKVSSKSVALVDNRDHGITQRKANTTGLPDQLKSGIENLSGIDMSDTKVHYNSSKPAKLNAHAYAQGTDIHLASGQEKHLPHEAWHVVQQKQGRVKPTMQMKGKVNVNDDSGLEKEADVMGAKALQLKTGLSLPLKSKSVSKKLTQLSALSDAEKVFKEHEKDLSDIRKRFKLEDAELKPTPNNDAAKGLDHWSKETQQAAMRHYNELYFLRDFKGKITNRLGKSNKSEPDIIGKSGTHSYHTEIKTTNTITNSEVTTLVRKALKQLHKRAPSGTWSAHIGLYLENPLCTWPGFLSRPKDTSEFVKGLKFQTSIKGHMKKDYPNISIVSFHIFYKGVGYKSYGDIDLNTL